MLRALLLIIFAAAALRPLPLSAQPAGRTLVAVFAHPDDEISVAPILARYAREGVRVFLISATDGSQGGKNTSIARGAELALERAREARCATDALGIEPPILWNFPDGQIGHYIGDPTTMARLVERVHQELQRLRPDALLTWGPDGGTGHPDHRLISNVVTQLVRNGAPGVPERLFYASLPIEAMRAMNPARPEPYMLVPRPKYFSVRVPFTVADAAAAQRAMACHRTQYVGETVQRYFEAAGKVMNGALPLAPANPEMRGTDLFR